MCNESAYYALVYMCQRYTVVGVCSVCNSISRRTLKLSAACMNAVQAQCDNISKLNSLRFLNKGFAHSLWRDLLTSNAVVACSRHAEEKPACKTDLLAT